MVIYIRIDARNFNDEWEVNKINLIIPNILGFDNRPARDNDIGVLASQCTSGNQ